MVRTSTAKSHGYTCPKCGDRLSRDRTGKGFVAHTNNPDCSFESNERDDYNAWRQVTNDDNGSLYTEDVKLEVGAIIQIRSESKQRTVTFVMGSDRKGWRACFSKQGALPTGAVEWRIVSFPTVNQQPTIAVRETAKQKVRSYQGIKSVAEFLAALVAIGGALVWFFS